MLKKRGQISVFIIIGIIIVLVLGLAFYLRARAHRIEGVEPIVEEIPTQLHPIKIFIEQCIDRTATDAVILIGESGGYTDISDFGITHTADPTISQAVEFSPESSMNVAYWWYLKSSNDCSGNCEFSSEMPDLKSEMKKGSERSFMDSSIEAQIDQYVNANLNKCLNDFRDFKDQGFEVRELGKITTTTIIRQDDVLVSVNYPLEIAKDKVKSKASSFFTTIPVNLKNVYELAFMITSDEINYNFLERNTLNLIAGFSEINNEKLPPMAGSKFELSSPVYWTKPDVKTKLEAMLMSYVPLLQVEDTLNYRKRMFDDSIKQRVYSQMDIPSYGYSYKKLGVDFRYLGWWPIYFDINTKSGIIMPESASTNILPLDIGIQRYNFLYDISYPVVITINSPESFHGKGYSFRFALEANIRNNEAINSSFVSLEGKSAEASMFCDINKRNSGNIKITTADAQTNEALNNVMIYYSCGDESCFIGETEMKEDKAVLETKFPICAGGKITFTKPDFLGYSEFLSTEVDKDINLPLTKLEPFVYKNIEIKKKKIIKGDDGWTFSNNAFGLSGKEQAILTLERIGKDGDEEFSTAAQYTGGQDEPSELRIVPGKYKANIQLILNEKIVIPEEKKMLLFFQIATLPEIELEPFPAGGLVFDETIAWNAGDITNYDNIEFYSLYIDIPSIPESERKHDDMDEMNKIEEYSKNYRASLEPVLR
ncbi:MAG: hypothetical protein KKE93_00935 [Nanoarchaeota archaeon]|nr:hypothetical protein [Nanoarchaeota archaeon]